MSSALMPDGNAKPWAAPSSAASAPANALVVGLPQRPYSYPLRSSPGRSCTNVDATCIGGTTSPVTGSGSNPAWMASVAKSVQSVVLMLLRYEAVADHAGEFRPPVVCDSAAYTQPASAMRACSSRDATAPSESLPQGT